MPYYYFDNHPVVEDEILKSIDKGMNVFIPDGVKRVFGEKTEQDIKDNRFGNDLFYNAVNQNNIIQQVFLPNAGVRIIGEKAFEHCHYLFNINFPDGLEEIRLSAFLCCYRLRSITLPKSIKFLDEWCFDLIDNLVANYKGTTAEWNQIKKGTDWAKKGTLINTSDGEFIL